jgi:DmsE family decaheme c-type cytochrome
MKKRLSALTILQALAIAFCLAAVSSPATAQDAAKAPRQDMVLKGDAKCTRCHDESEEYPVLAIAKTRHGMTGDARTPTCTSCHGESATHINKPEGVKERPKPERVFGKKSATTADSQNGACLTCHQSGLRMNWQGAQHQSADVPCAACHQVHSAKDKVLAKTTQPEVCFTCHKEQRAQVNRPSHHPIMEGKVSCSSCHNPHGSVGPKQLAKTTLNETCYTCHTEKRGPFLWEHPPAREDCTNCHVPHGSIHTPLLKARGPWLCQECHLAQFHPSTAYSGTGIPPRGATQQVLANNCLNCHSQVHGSNHPSGARKTR